MYKPISSIQESVTKEAEETTVRVEPREVEVLSVPEAIERVEVVDGAAVGGVYTSMMLVQYPVVVGSLDSVTASLNVKSIMMVVEVGVKVMTVLYS
jgi:hypothetical protein